MPQPPLTAQERRFQAFCRLSAAAYGAGAIACAAAPWLGLAALPSALLAALLICAATACLVAAGRPRERRHAVLPVVAAQLTACILALAHLGAPGQRALLLAGAPLLLLTSFIYRSAAPGVRSEPAREGPSVEEPPRAPVQLGIKKAN